MLAHTFEQTASLITTSINKYGDQVLVSTKDIQCRFRWITELQNPGNREELSSDALLWADSDQSIAEGTIIKVDDTYFRVNRVTKARRLRGDQVYFIKCLLDKYAGGIDGS